MEEAEAENMEFDSFITQGDVTEAGGKLLSGKEPDVAVLVDMSMQYHVAVMDSASVLADWGSGPST